MTDLDFGEIPRFDTQPLYQKWKFVAKRFLQSLTPDFRNRFRNIFKPGEYSVIGFQEISLKQINPLNGLGQLDLGKFPQTVQEFWCSRKYLPTEP